MADKVSIKGLDKAAVFAALYNGARAQGLGFLHYSSSSMTAQEARLRFGSHFGSFDYVDGRVMKVDLSGDTFDPWLYDRDNGAGAASNIIATLRSTGKVNDEKIAGQHAQGIKDAAEELQPHTGTKSNAYTGDGRVGFELGLEEFKDDLDPILRQILRNRNK